MYWKIPSPDVIHYEKVDCTIILAYDAIPYGLA